MRNKDIKTEMTKIFVNILTNNGAHLEECVKSLKKGNNGVAFLLSFQLGVQQKLTYL